MRHVSVYESPNRSNSVQKQSLIFDHVLYALSTLRDIECRFHGVASKDLSGSPGLREVRSESKIVALGLAAHTALADFQKNSLVVGFAGINDLEEDIERLFWSCINTMKISCIGVEAWRDIQVLPSIGRRLFELPPLRMRRIQREPGGPEQATKLGFNILVVNHQSDTHDADQITQVLMSEGYTVEPAARVLGEDEQMPTAWASTAAVHLHVGWHLSDSEGIRLLDTWHSGRLAILYIPSESAHTSLPNSLMVDPEVNGFFCYTHRSVLSACLEIWSDAVFRKKLEQAGIASAAPLARDWHLIAENLVS